MTSWSRTRFAILGAVAFGTDQGIKAWVEASLTTHVRVEMLPFFSLFRARNTGIAFSSFADLSMPMLAALTTGVTLLFLYMASRTEAYQVWARGGFALIVAGALGNLTDRVTLGYVVDYLLIHTETWSFAVFNLADVFISIGAGLLLLQEFLDIRRSRGLSRARP